MIVTIPLNAKAKVKSEQIIEKTSLFTLPENCLERKAKKQQLEKKLKMSRNNKIKVER